MVAAIITLTFLLSLGVSAFLARAIAQRAMDKINERIEELNDVERIRARFRELEHERSRLPLVLRQRRD